MVASSIARISPLLQGNNGYLLSIGWKDRFLVVNVENKSKNKINNKNGEQKERTPLQTMKGFSSNTLEEHVRNLQTNHGNLQGNMG